MKRYLGTVACALLAAAAAILMAAPTVFPTGTTIYDPAKTWNGYTVLSPLGTQAAIVIDMNGNIVKRWDGYNSAAGGPARILPGGIVIDASGSNPGHQESTALIEKDFSGKEIWRFDHTEEITLDGAKQWSARQTHDWSRADFPGGYYSPDAKPAAVGANTLILTKTNHVVPAVNPTQTLEDDHIIEVSSDGKILWQWLSSDHIDEFKFSPEARDAIAGKAGPPPAPAPAGGPGAAKGGPGAGKGGPGAGKGGPGAAKGGPGAGKGGGRGAAGAGPGGGAGGGRGYDWLHLNAIAYVGPNHWYDDGDKRFAPENVIISSREASLLAIIGRDGHIVWQMGPDYQATPELRAIRQIIGQHAVHFIAKGLPGAGNILVFDNGGPSGYGAPGPNSPNGKNIYARASSRVAEIDPVNLKLVWSYTNGANFYATNISGAQRLPNGDTLITEGPTGRVFEVNTDGDIVWEYIYADATPPAAAAPGGAGGKGGGKGGAKGGGAGGGKAAAKGNGGPGGNRAASTLFRAYRLPYDWIPQLPKPTEKAVTPPKAADFRVP